MKPHITNKEWKRIVEQTSRADLPEPPFSQRYRDRRLELERMVTMREERKITFQPGLALATAAALAIAAVPAGMIWHMSRSNITLPPEPSVSTAIAPAAAVTEPMPEETIASIDNSFKSVEYGWLPEGMYLHGEDSPYAGKIHADPESDDLRGITPDLIRLPEGMDFDTFKDQVKDVLQRNGRLDDAAAVAFGDTGESNFNCLRVLHNGNGWDEVWFPFDGTPYVMHLYYQGVTDYEIRQVLQNLRLVPAEEEMASHWIDQEDRSSDELEFALISDIDLTEINLQDTPWQGKAVEATEIGGLPFETANLAEARNGEQVYPSLQMQYHASGLFGDKVYDLMYTEAPAEEIQWGETDGYFEILDFVDFRVCIAAWSCDAEEIEAVRSAVICAAGHYEVNSHGESYGCAWLHMDRSTYDLLPDLIAFGSDKSQECYAKKTDLFEQLGDDPDDAQNHLMQDFNRSTAAVEFASLDLYDVEGETVLDVVKYYKEP